MGFTIISMKYKKGDIVTINFPFTDLSISKKRPALIISNNIINKTGEYLMVQITSQEKTDLLTLSITKNDYENSYELPLKSYIRLHKIFLLNDSLILGLSARINDSFLQKVISKIVDLIINCLSPISKLN
jgi:mRNA interferase MazF